MGNRIRWNCGCSFCITQVVGENFEVQDISCFVVLFLVFSGIVQISPAKAEKASLKSPGAGGIYHCCGMVNVFLFLFIVFYIFSSFNNMYGSLSALIMVML